MVHGFQVCLRRRVCFQVCLTVNLLPSLHYCRLSSCFINQTRTSQKYGHWVHAFLPVLPSHLVPPLKQEIICSLTGLCFQKNKNLDISAYCPWTQRNLWASSAGSMSSAQRKQSWAWVCYPEVLTMPGETQGSETQERFAVGRYKAGKEVLTGLPCKGWPDLNEQVHSSEWAHLGAQKQGKREKKIPGASSLL